MQLRQPFQNCSVTNMTDASSNEDSDALSKRRKHCKSSSEKTEQVMQKISEVCSESESYSKEKDESDRDKLNDANFKRNGFVYLERRRFIVGEHADTLNHAACKEELDYINYMDNAAKWCELDRSSKTRIMRKYHLSAFGGRRIRCLTSTCDKSLTTVGGMLHHISACFELRNESGAAEKAYVDYKDKTGDWLKLDAPTRSQLLRDYIETNDVGRLQCINCSRVFTSSEAFNFHLQKCGPGLLQEVNNCCDTSPGSYIDYKNRTEDWMVLHADVRAEMFRAYALGECGSRTKPITRKRSQLECIGCDKVLTSYDGMLHHLRRCAGGLLETSKVVLANSSNTVPKVSVDDQCPTALEVASSPIDKCDNYLAFNGKIEQWNMLDEDLKRQLLLDYTKTQANKKKKHVPCIGCSKILTTYEGMIYHMKKCQNGLLKESQRVSPCVSELPKEDFSEQFSTVGFSSYFKSGIGVILAPQPRRSATLAMEKIKAYHSPDPPVLTKPLSKAYACTASSSQAAKEDDVEEDAVQLKSEVDADYKDDAETAGSEDGEEDSESDDDSSRSCSGASQFNELRCVGSLEQTRRAPKSRVTAFDDDKRRKQFMGECWQRHVALMKRRIETRHSFKMPEWTLSAELQEPVEVSKSLLAVLERKAESSVFDNPSTSFATAAAPNRSLPFRFDASSVEEPLHSLDAFQSATSPAGRPVLICKWFPQQLRAENEDSTISLTHDISVSSDVRHLLVVTDSSVEMQLSRTDCAYLQIYRVNLAALSTNLLYRIRLPDVGQVWSTSFAPFRSFNSRTLAFIACATQSGRIVVLRLPNVLVHTSDVRTYEAMICLELAVPFDRAPALSVDWSPFENCGQIIGSYGTGTICVWDLSNVCADALLGVSSIASFCVSPSGSPVKQVYWTSANTFVALAENMYIWKLSTESCINRFFAQDTYLPTACLPIYLDPRCYFCAAVFRGKSLGRSVYCATARNTTLLSENFAHSVWSFAASPFGHVLVGSNDGSVRVCLQDFWDSAVPLYMDKPLHETGWKCDADQYASVGDCYASGCSLVLHESTFANVVKEFRSSAAAVKHKRKKQKSDSEKTPTLARMLLDAEAPLAAVFCIDVMPEENLDEKNAENAEFHYCFGMQCGFVKIAKTML